MCSFEIGLVGVWYPYLGIRSRDIHKLFTYRRRNKTKRGKYFWVKWIIGCLRPVMQLAFRCRNHDCKKKRYFRKPKN